MRYEFMNPFNAVRSLLGGGGELGTLGPVARAYAEGGAPSEEWAAAERDGRVNVLVTVAGEPTPEQPVDTDAVEARIRGLGGYVEHAHGGGFVSGWLAPDEIRSLAASNGVERVEVTRPGGNVTDDPDYPG
jgi:hypothetical protein